MVFLHKALMPTAVLHFPAEVVLADNADQPIAVLWVPPIFAARALAPFAVL